MTNIEKFLSQDNIIDLILNKDFEKVYLHAKKDLMLFEIGQLT